MLELRNYQLKMVAQVREQMQQGHRAICLTAPTGAGKTALAVHMLHTAANKGMPSWFTCHRREILKQTNQAFALEGLRHGIVAVGFQEDRRHKVQITSIQTLMRRHKKLTAPKLIVIDECHHMLAPSWANLFSHYPNTFFVGLSATPERADGQGLGKFFSSLVVGPSVQWLIQNKFLSDYRLYAPSKVNLDGVHTRMGDYVQSEVTSIIDKPGITGDVIAHYKRFCAGKRAIVFCVSVAHSKHVVDSFNAAQIPAAHVDGETPQEERDATIRRFRDGHISLLSNVELFGEGFDVPSIEATILLRPTQSLGLYLQQVGRGLRPAPGKAQAIILDHVGNCERHGLPDEDRSWSLDGHRDNRKSQQSSGSVRICDRCFAAQFSGRPACQFCGFIFEKSPREIDQKEGELSEIDKEAIRRQRMKEQGSALDRNALLALAIKRGYKSPHGWVAHILRSRQARKLAGMI